MTLVSRNSPSIALNELSKRCAKKPHAKIADDNEREVFGNYSSGYFVAASTNALSSSHTASTFVGLLPISEGPRGDGVRIARVNVPLRRLASTNVHCA